MSREKPVVVVSGKIASGKTAFANALAQELGMTSTGFGDEVRAIAAARGQPFMREVLQPIGEALVANDAKGFCQMILKRGAYKIGEGLVIEGLRHVQVLSFLKELVAPDCVFHVHITGLEDLRTDRVNQRARPGDAALETMDAHSTEIQLVKDLPDVADITIDGNRSLEHMVASAISQIKMLQKQQDVASS